MAELSPRQPQPNSQWLRGWNVGCAQFGIVDRLNAGCVAAEISLNIVAAYNETDWELVGELAESMTTIILTANPNPDDASLAVSAGAFGYVDTHLTSDAIRRSILGAMQGEHAYSRRVLSTLIRNGRWLRVPSALPLTPRQREVIVLIAKGAADKEIARSLGITTATAQKHVTNLLKRLNVPNRAAAVAAMSIAS